MEVSVFWFRRDLRLKDNKALEAAGKSGYPILPIFIFDEDIIDTLEVDDARITFIYDTLQEIDLQLKQNKSALLCLKGKPIEVWSDLLSKYNVKAVFCNRDYEPYAIKRDALVKQRLEEEGISMTTCKDQVIFEESEVVKDDGKPYTVYTPYKNKWLKLFQKEYIEEASTPDKEAFYQHNIDFPTLEKIGFNRSSIKVRGFHLNDLDKYGETRDFPAQDKTSYLSPHLRFGTINVREIIRKLGENTEVFLSELVWREFFMQILYHFPKVVDTNFKSKYNTIEWRNQPEEFKAWCEGNTGYPLVDAGMRQLNETGYMHNRVRMVTAGFLCKHLLIDWKWGEAYFASKLLDYDLSANNGNWQWAAGTGCDAAPYFRIFNPIEQLKKFDKNLDYIKKWVPEFQEFGYVQPIVDHKLARVRALETYKKGLELAV